MRMVCGRSKGPFRDSLLSFFRLNYIWQTLFKNGNKAEFSEEGGAVFVQRSWLHTLSQ